MKKAEWVKIELTEKATKQLRRGKAVQVMNCKRHFYIVPFKRELSADYLRRRVAYLEKKLREKEKGKK